MQRQEDEKKSILIKDDDCHDKYTLPLSFYGLILFSFSYSSLIHEEIDSTILSF